MNLIHYFSIWWSTGQFLSEFIAGFFVVLFLLFPMFFIPFLNLKSKNAEHLITLSAQAFGVTFAILIGKFSGDMMLTGGVPESAPALAAVGIGNASGDLTVAFEFMEFKGIPYIMAANVGGGITGAVVAYFIFTLYNKTMTEKMDLNWIFSNPVKKHRWLFANELIFVPIWLIGVSGIIGLSGVDFALRNLTITFLAIVLLFASSPFGFFILAFNFNLGKWLVGVVFLRNFNRHEALHLLCALMINFGYSIAVGSMFYGMAKMESATVATTFASKPFVENNFLNAFKHIISVRNY